MNSPLKAPRSLVRWNPSLEPSLPPRVPSGLCGKTWDRLEIEEDVETRWYVLNCVAGVELDLLNQCRKRCREMEDVEKFVVPVLSATRSHGASRIVTETKVKYQGYVFAKLRLCPETYEAIRELDLCRSWMGTVNRRGNRKLPPAPVPLNRLEVKDFGLDALQEGEEYQPTINTAVQAVGDVILDSAEEEALESAKDSKQEEALKVYLGLRVDDMIKVTKNKKFLNEDGIVKRLKDGKIKVRFYTYGSLYDEWLEPDEVRKMSNEEILRGLSGPTAPITDRNMRDGGRRPNDIRQSLMSNVKGHRGDRNRRQDRVARGDRQKRGDPFGRTEREWRDEERNWKWYQDQERGKRGRGPSDGQYEYQAGSRQRQGDWNQGSPDAQWGRNYPQRQERNFRNNDFRNNDRRNDFRNNDFRNNDRRNNDFRNNDFRSNDRRNNDFRNNDRRNNDFRSNDRRNNDFRNNDRRNNDFRNNDRRNNDFRNNDRRSNENRRMDSAISGDDDWSSFVSPARAPNNNSPQEPQRDADDDFFSSLMSNLSGDLEEEKKQPPAPRKMNAGDDFFASLMSDLADDDDDKPPVKDPKVSKAEDDFFSSLEAELGGLDDLGLDNVDDFFTKLDQELPADTDKPSDFFNAVDAVTDETAKPKKGKPTKKAANEEDDFFSQLEAGLESSFQSDESSDSKDDDIFGAFSAGGSSGGSSDDSFETDASAGDSAGVDDFFAGLEAELGTAMSEEPALDLDNFWNNDGGDSATDDKALPKATPPKPKATAPKPKTTSPEPSSTAAVQAGDLQKKTVAVLKDMLRERGLKVSGKKAELIERLTHAA